MCHLGSILGASEELKRWINDTFRSLEAMAATIASTRAVADGIHAQRSTERVEGYGVGLTCAFMSPIRWLLAPELSSPVYHMRARPLVKTIAVGWTEWLLPVVPSADAKLPSGAGTLSSGSPPCTGTQLNPSRLVAADVTQKAPPLSACNRLL